MNSHLPTEIIPLRKSTNSIEDTVSENNFFKARKSNDSNEKVHMKIYKMQSLIKEHFRETKFANNWAFKAMITASKITLNLKDRRNDSFSPP